MGESHNLIFSESALNQLYITIVRYCTKKLYSPSIRELCNLTGFSSSGTVRLQLQELVRQGRITWDGNGKARTIALTNYKLVKCEPSEP